MTKLIRKIRIWWLNGQISEAIRRMDYHFKRQELDTARAIQDRFHKLIKERNSMEAQQ